MLVLRYVAVVFIFLALSGVEPTSASPSPQAKQPAWEYWVCFTTDSRTGPDHFFHSSIFRSLATLEEIQAAFIKYMSGKYGDYAESNGQCLGFYNYGFAFGNLSKHLALASSASMLITDTGWAYGVGPPAATNQIYVYCAAYEANGPLVFTRVFVMPRTSGYPQNWSEGPAVAQAFKNSIHDSGAVIEAGAGADCNSFDDRQSAEAELKFEESGEHYPVGRAWKEISWSIYH
jgi:hypothetical protein